MATLISPSQAHGAVQVLGVMELHINPDILRETSGEQLGLL